LLLVESNALGRAVEALQSCAGVLDAAVFGDALHLVVKDAAAAIPQLQEFFADNNIAVGRMEKISPTLEDVFVALTTTRDAGKERAA
jgi:ABC-2 type transport system ATP-binding protein